MERKEGDFGEGGGIYRESEGVPKGFTCLDFVGDVRFRSLVGFMKESSSWYENNIMIIIIIIVMAIHA